MVDKSKTALPRTDYTRDELINLCVRALVTQENWRNRDSQSAQKNVGECWALLRAGCEFTVRSPDAADAGPCATDADTIWIDIRSRGFDWFEGAVCRTPVMQQLQGVPPDIHTPDDRDDLLEDETFYLPTPARLEKAGGKDWY